MRGEAEIVTNSIDLDLCRPAGPAERREARKRLGIGTEPLVVCVGRLSWQKGQDLLLQAWSGVRSALPTAVLILIGDGPARESLARRSVPGVQFVGTRDDVADWHAAADLVAVPSRYEGLSLALLEALARGRAVVAHDVCGVGEVLGRTGHPKAGALVQLGDGGALADAILARLLDPNMAAEEGVAGRRLVEKNHDLNVWADRLCTITERVAARP